MTYGFEISFNGMPLGEPVDNKDLAISSPLPPWVVTAGGELGEKLRQMKVGASGSISETRNGRTVDHSVKLKSLEDLGDGRVRATYDPAS